MVMVDISIHVTDFPSPIWYRQFFLNVPYLNSRCQLRQLRLFANVNLGLLFFWSNTICAGLIHYAEVNSGCQVFSRVWRYPEFFPVPGPVLFSGTNFFRDLSECGEWGSIRFRKSKTNAFFCLFPVWAYLGVGCQRNTCQHDIITSQCKCLL